MPLCRRTIPLVLLLALPACGWSLEASQFRQLAALSDEFVGNIIADDVAWLGDERGLVVGGWEQWPARPMILIAPRGSQALKIDTAANPSFALSPARDALAYWAATGGGWCQLAVLPLAGGGPRYVGQPQQVGPAMHLAWPTEYTICALIQEPGACSAVAINSATGASRPMVRVEGGQWARLRHTPGWDPIAVWAGDSKKCFRLVTTGRSEEISPDFDYDRARPDSEFYSYFDHAGALWVGGVTGLAPTKVADNAGAATWAPDGSILLYTIGNQLWAMWPKTSETRRIAGTALENAGLETGAPYGLSWSGDGGHVAYWRQSGASGQVRRVKFGLEEILARIRYGPGVRLEAGHKIWVAKKLYFDDAGKIIEPVWETLKGSFAVRKVTAGAGETIIEAINIGSQAGVLERMAGRARPQPDGVAPDPAFFSLKPVPGLIAWPQGTKVSGEMLSIEVRLAPLGSAR